MFKLRRANPLLDQAIRTGWPSLPVTLVLVAAVCIGATVGRDWLVSYLSSHAGTMLLLFLWLLPLVTMAAAAISTARQARTESFQLVRQSPLADCQVVWGLGLSTLYSSRMVLGLALGLLIVLVDDSLVGSTLTALCLAGLHLGGSMLGTALVLRWGRRRLGVLLAALYSTLILLLLPTFITLLSPIVAPGCPFTSLTPIDLRLSTLLRFCGLQGALPVVAATVLPFLMAGMAGLIPWRGRGEGWLPRLEMLGGVLAVVLILGEVVTGARLNERQALVALYQATGGRSWPHQSGWLSEQPVCSWEGVTCTCGKITRLDLYDNNLYGDLPPEIGQLTNLQKLYLISGQLTELPPEIGQLSNLQILNLTQNNLTELPPETGQLSNLAILSLSQNNLTELPPEIDQLANLRELYLDSNQLTELPPGAGQLSNLAILSLSQNNLTKLPPEIGQLANLQILDLSDNRLTELPPEISRLTNLSLLIDDTLAGLVPEVCELGLHVEPSMLCNYVDPLPGNSPEMAVALPNGTLACGLGQVKWGQQAFDLADYPACQATFPEVAVHCLNGQGEWTDDAIRVTDVSEAAKMITLESQREGICGIFPQD